MGYNVVTAGFCVSIDKPIYAGAVSLGRGMVVIIATLGLMVILFGGIGIWISTFISEVIVMVYARKILLKCKNDVENRKEDMELIEA